MCEHKHAKEPARDIWYLVVANIVRAGSPVVSYFEICANFEWIKQGEADTGEEKKGSSLIRVAVDFRKGSWCYGRSLIVDKEIDELRD